MAEPFFERPILNSPYRQPVRHWELDDDGQPTNRVIDARRRSDLITPVPKPKKQKAKPAGKRGQSAFTFSDELGLSSDEQEYNPTPIINELRTYVEVWRNLPNPDQWLVTPGTARLLKHWRTHPFEAIRPFFCQVEAVETAIWLVEVAPKMGPRYQKFWKHLEGANAQANPELMRLALKLATGAGKTTVMAPPSTLWSRSRATTAKTPRRRPTRCAPTGCRASTTWPGSGAGTSPSSRQSTRSSAHFQN